MPDKPAWQYKTFRRERKFGNKNLAVAPSNLMEETTSDDT
jgi:hypothetical protein